MNPFRGPNSPPAEDDRNDKRLVEFVRDERDYDREAFDRLAYARQLLRLLKVRRRVALCVGTEKIQLDQGGWHGLPMQPPWAILSIPPDASRAHIALTIAQLAGRSRDPFLLDTLLRVRPA